MEINSGRPCTYEWPPKASQQRDGTIAGADLPPVRCHGLPRIAFIAMRPDEKTPEAVHFLNDAVAYHAKPGVGIKRLWTDNGSAFRSRNFARACEGMGI